MRHGTIMDIEPHLRTMKSISLLIVFLLLTACGGENSAGDEGIANATPEERGRREFRVCATCHTVKNPQDHKLPRLIGPNLWGIVGKPAASDEKFAYSAAFRKVDFIWTEERLSQYIENPQAFVKGNRMSFVGEPSAESRADIIAYLKTLK